MNYDGRWLILLLGLWNSGCQSHHRTPVLEVEEPLRQYVKRFLEEGAARNVVITQKNLVVRFDTLGEHRTGRCRPNTDPQEIDIDISLWQQMDHWRRELVVFHELGHCILNRGHRNEILAHGECASIMEGREGGFGCSINFYASTWREYYLDELFDESTEIPDWYISALSTTAVNPQEYVLQTIDTVLSARKDYPLRIFRDTVVWNPARNFTIEVTHSTVTDRGAIHWNNLVFEYRQPIVLIEYNSPSLDGDFRPMRRVYHLSELYRNEIELSEKYLNMRIDKTDDRLSFFINDRLLHQMDTNWVEEYTLLPLENQLRTASNNHDTPVTIQVYYRE